MKKSSIAQLLIFVIEVLAAYSIYLLNSQGHDHFVRGILFIIATMNLAVCLMTQTSDKDKILVMDNETWLSNLQSRSAQAQADGDFKLHEYYEFQIRTAKASEAMWTARQEEP